MSVRGQVAEGNWERARGDACRKCGQEVYRLHNGLCSECETQAIIAGLLLESECPKCYQPSWLTSDGEQICPHCRGGFDCQKP